MTPLLITGARIAAASGLIDGGWLLTDGGSIAAFGPGDPDDAAIADTLGPPRDPTVVTADGRWLLPGFVDVHVHGALGHETMDGDVDGLARMDGF